MLDHSRVIGTMGALLSLCNDKQTILGVCPDKVAILYQGAEEISDVVKFGRRGTRWLLYGFVKGDGCW